MKVLIVVTVVIITAIQAVSPLYQSINETQNQEELPIDGTSENEIKEVQESEFEKILSDNLTNKQDSFMMLGSSSETTNLTQQYHRDLCDPPPEML